ncbi:hypothetical protein [Stenotrophomonas sp. PS02289]|uniref:hypothetical protein n=1 Tax=Stenotrophomonas sp. PS02289 TaxID=2991422 RepID=UPI00249A3BB1|nr:hypothetical protein [Stenotrophomonas sp. PS02289]
MLIKTKEGAVTRPQGGRMSRSSSVFVALCLCLAGAFGLFGLLGLAWMLYPTSISFKLETFAALRHDEFLDVRRSAEAFALTVESKGIEFRAGSERTHSFSFRCKGVPLLFVDNGPDILFVSAMAGADDRAPDLRRFRENMVAVLKRSGQPAGPPGPPDEPTGLDAFVLKHRDRVDLSQQCR